MKKILVSLCITIVLVVCYQAFYAPKLDVSKMDIGKYIEVADEMSAGIGQINWKYLLAVDQVKTKGESDQNQLMKMREFFVDGTKVNSLEELLNELGFSTKQKEEVNRYLVDSDQWGITPNRIKGDTRYTKFIAEVKNGSISNYEKYGILPSITIAQAILESDWGRSQLTVDGNNLFGIKANPSWQGQRMSMNTKEFNDTYVQADFRKYDNKDASILDHGKFLNDNQRYKKYGLFKGETYIEQARSLEDAGYSTAQDEDGKKYIQICSSNLFVNIICS